MLLELPDLIEKHHMTITSVVHAGAHLGEEMDLYRSLNLQVLWVDPITENCQHVLNRIRIENVPHQYVIKALITDKVGDEIPFHITNYDGMSSSIFEFGTHPQFSPDTFFMRTEVMETHTLDELVMSYDWEFDFLNMDIQGAELKALHGATKMLNQINYIYTEVNKDEVYKGCAKIWELDDFLIGRGFARVETEWVGDQGWGDALYIRHFA